MSGKNFSETRVGSIGLHNSGGCERLISSDRARHFVPAHRRFILFPCRAEQARQSPLPDIAMTAGTSLDKT
jgi:hypothetical protein